MYWKWTWEKVKSHEIIRKKYRNKNFCTWFDIVSNSAEKTEISNFRQIERNVNITFDKYLLTCQFFGDIKDITECILLNKFSDDRTKVHHNTMLGRKRKLSTYRSKTKIKKLAADRKEKRKEITVVPRYDGISSTSSDEYVNVTDESNGEISSNETDGEVLSGPSDVDNDLNVSHESNVDNSNGKVDSFKEKCVILCNPVLMTEIVDKCGQVEIYLTS